jgi:hypothetical protein
MKRIILFLLAVMLLAPPAALSAANVPVLLQPAEKVALWIGQRIGSKFPIVWIRGSTTDE